MSTQATQIEIEEYKSLRDQIKFNIDYMEQNDRNSLLAAAAIYAAIFFKGEVQGLIAVIACAIPLFIFSISYIRYRAIDDMIGHINDYIIKIENIHPELDWTTFYRRESKRSLRHSRGLYWSCVLWGSSGILAVFIIMTVHGAKG